MFLGSLFHTIKGGIDSVTIRRKLKECQTWLSVDELSSLKPYQRFLVQERLLLTEYMIRCSQLRAKGASLSDLIDLKERMNRKMEDLVKNAQQELASHPANKLDVAQLVSGIQQLSIAIDKDQNTFKKDINNLQIDISNFQKDLVSLKKDLTTFKKDTHNLQQEQQRQADCLKALEDDLKLTSKRLETEIKKINVLVKRRLRFMGVFYILMFSLLGIIIYNVLR